MYAIYEQTMRPCDTLTKLLNRQTIIEQAQNTLELSKNTKQPMSLLLLDIDLFRTINEKYGHSCGDNALQLFANLLRHNTYSPNLVGRLHEDEFLLILPDTRQSDAQEIAEKILVNIENTGRFQCNQSSTVIEIKTDDLLFIS